MMTPQQLAERKLKHARRQMSAAASRIKRATTSLRLWEQRAMYYAKRASLTDAELAAEKVKRAQRQPKPKRAIKVGGL